VKHVYTRAKHSIETPIKHKIRPNRLKCPQSHAVKTDNLLYN